MGHDELFRRMGCTGHYKNAHHHTKHTRLDYGEAGPRAYRDKHPKELTSIEHELGPKKYRCGGKVKRQRLAVGAVAKIRKGQY